MTLRRPPPFDPAQASLFDAPLAPVDLGDFAQQVRATLAGTLARAREEEGLDRHAVAAGMNRVMGDGDDDGREITKRMLDNWAAPSAAEWRFPLEVLPALLRVTGDDSLLKLVMAACGQRAVPAEAAVLGELMVLELQERRIREKKEALRKALPAGALEWATREVGRRGRRS